MANKQVISAPELAPALGPYSQAIKANGMVFCSGAIGIDKEGNLKEGVKAQTQQAFENLGFILKAAGCGYGDIVHCICYLANMDDFAAFNEVYATYFSKDAGYPSRACTAAKTLPKNASVEVVATAVCPK